MQASRKSALENPPLRVSFCIRCMGRLHHLKETLAQNIHDNRDYPNLEFVTLDYNSPDGLGEWIHKEMSKEIESGLITYVRDDTPKYFHPAHANNMSHRAASGEALCNLDADNFTGPGFAAWINQTLSRDPLCVGHPTLVREEAPGVEGRIFLHRRSFEILGGYDETYQSYGWDDTDLLTRAQAMGFPTVPIPDRFLKCISHGGQERLQNLADPSERGMRENYDIHSKRYEQLRLRRVPDAACPMFFPHDHPKDTSSRLIPYPTQRGA